ncbi:MAG: molybdopterin synthase catalytic subunit [Paraglaciecola sp.]|jgi:molybdopterin synthase catalytic subunit
MEDVIVVQTADFEMQTLYQQLRQANTTDGAIVTFTGLVRDFNQQLQVSGLYLEHYPAMTKKALHEIVNEARHRWELGRVSVLHRVGHLAPGEQIVFVGVTSAHRQNAFAACEFIMDYLKTQAPFWKKEMTNQGHNWVTAKQQDKAAADKWDQ